MKKLISLLLLPILLAFLLGCETPPQPSSGDDVVIVEAELATEADLDEELSELNELEQLIDELEEDVDFTELEDLSLE